MNRREAMKLAAATIAAAALPAMPVEAPIYGFFLTGPFLTVVYADCVKRSPPTHFDHFGRSYELLCFGDTAKDYPNKTVVVYGRPDWWHARYWSGEEVEC